MDNEIQRLIDIIKEKESNDENEFSVKKEISEFNEYLESLYKKIKETLSMLESSNVATISEEEINIEEEDLGEYKSKRLDVKLKKGIIHFIPEGTMFIGAKGRVLVTGFGKREVIMLIRKDAKNLMEAAFSKSQGELSWEWKILNRESINNNKEPNFIDINHHSILSLMVRMINA